MENVSKELIFMTIPVYFLVPILYSSTAGVNESKEKSIKLGTLLYLLDL